MAFDPWLAVAGAFGGFVVGLTGMGGGALMTPMLVLIFNVQPLAAVSNDLVVSLVMKPVGGAVHARRGTVHKGLVTWLCIGSVPGAFAGVLLLRALGNDAGIQTVVKHALGATLVISALAMIARAVLSLRREARDRAAGITPSDDALAGIVVKKMPTLLVGVLGGVVVGMTSVGSGSLIIVALLLMYPTLRSSELVGTDLVQAVPLVASASVGHLIFGDFQLDLTTTLLIGAIPGVYLGAKISSTTPGGLVRRALVLVLLASGLKLLDLGISTVAIILITFVLVGPVVWAFVRNTSGFEVPPHRIDGVPKWRLVVRAAIGKEGAPTTSARTAAPPGHDRASSR